MSRGAANQLVPFEVDTALEDQIAAYREQNDLDDWSKTLYPDMKVHQAPPPTAREKKLVSIYRKQRTAMRNGPFFMDEPKTGKRDAAEFNAFEDVATYGNKKAKRTGGLPNLKKVPIVKELLPRELWDIVSDGEEENGDSTKKNLTFLKKKRLDKLAQFDEGADVPATGDDDAANEDENEDEDGVEVPEDDDFSEDDSDLGNDYNAEKYFDDGDGVDDDGDDAGGDEACPKQRGAPVDEKDDGVGCAGDPVEEKERHTHGQNQRHKAHRNDDFRNIFDEKERAWAQAEAIERRLGELIGQRKIREPLEEDRWRQTVEQKKRLRAAYV